MIDVINHLLNNGKNVKEKVNLITLRRKYENYK